MAVGNGRADLHVHTTASDGLYKPAEVVRKAKESGLSALAITDHDTIAGVEEALEEGRRLGVMVVPGVELSTIANGRDIHILAYYTNNNDPLWRRRLESLGDTRTRRNEAMLAKLQKMGIPISLKDVLRASNGKGDASAERSLSTSIGRPHIAAALISLGVVSSMEEAFRLYLGEGAAAFVQVPKVHPSEAIDWVRECGGVSVIAHPGLYGDDRLVEELIQGGAAGIEVFHSDHGAEEVKKYAQLGERYGLIQTGGSDFHGEREGISFHGPLGSSSVDIEIAYRLRAFGGT